MFKLSAVISALTLTPTIEDVKSAANSSVVGTFATAINAVVFYVFVAHEDSSPVMTLWLVGTCVMCLIFGRMALQTRARTLTRVSPRLARRFCLAGVMLGAPWAALAIYWMGIRAEQDQLVIQQIIAGMLAGGAFALHRTFTAALCYLSVISAGLVVALPLGGSPQAWTGVVYCAVYFLVLSYCAFHMGETAREKDKSVAALSHANDNLQSANSANYRLLNIDDITGLLNRKAFNEKLAEAADTSRRTGAGFTLLMLDLDRFKNVNDLFGHSVGDALLEAIGRRLTAAVRDEDIVARLGGDEFAVIHFGCSDADTIADISERLLRDLSRPVNILGIHVHSGASIGAVTCPADSSDPTDLLVQADIALNHAKAVEKGRFVRFDDDLRQQIVDNNEMERRLRTALDAGRIFVQYQPKIRLADGSIFGAEALVRMHGPDDTTIAPDRFLSLAAERGLLPRLSRYIAQTVADDIRAWRAAGIDPGMIALNVHPDDIKSSDFVMSTLKLLRDTGVGPNDITLEITEGCFIGRGTDRARILLDTLSALGYALSLDDFGTGHASLSHLKTVPVDEIKIDRSFVAGIEDRRDDRAIVSAIAQIARGMGIQAVAEGVETQGQLAIIKELGLDLGQGYLWSKPIDAAAYLDLLRPRGSAVGAL